MRRLLAAALVTPILLAACSDDGGETKGPTVATDEVLAAVADEVIVPSYETLTDSLTELTTAIDALCDAPSAAALDDARAAWRAATEAWRATRAGGIGPAMDRRLNSAIGFLARPASIDKLLDGDDPLDPDSLEAAGAAVKGLSALELALFDDGSNELTTAAGARRCTYAASVSTLAHDKAEAVLDDWNDGYRDELVETMDPQDSLTLLVNEVSHRLTELDDQGLRSLVEADSLDDLANNRVDGPAAFRMAELRALLGGIATVIGEGRDDVRLDDLVAARDADLAERLDTATSEAVEAMDAVPDSVTEAFADQAALTDAQEKVAALKVLVATEVASELGVTISFSDADGDS